MIFRFFLSVAAICCFLNIADAQFYTTDVSFGNAGLVQTTYNGNHLNKATTCAVQPDSKVITAGYTENQGGGPINPFVVRLKEDGSLDSTFNGTGLLSFDLGYYFTTQHRNGRFNDIAIQSDGKILLAGYQSYVNPFAVVFVDILLVRLKTDGTMDSTFGTNGIAIKSNGITSQCESVALQADGKIVVGGFYNIQIGNVYGDEFMVARFKTDGSIDSAFGTNGFAIRNITSQHSGDFGYRVLIQPADGKIIEVGYTNDSLSGHYATSLMRLKSDGSADSTFGTNGAASYFYGSGADRYAAFTATLQTDGKIVVGGEYWQTGAYQNFMVSRFNANGSIDNTFATNGVLTFNAGQNANGQDVVQSVFIAPDSTIIAGGYSPSAPLNQNFTFARITSNGTLTTLGSQGVLYVDFNQYYDWASSIALDTATGKIVAAGYSGATLLDSISVFAVARIRTCPDIDLGAGFSACPSAHNTLDATNTNATYLWSNNATTPTISVTPGTYSVTVTTAQGCSASDNITIAPIALPDAQFTPTGAVDIITMVNNSLDATTYHWDFGDATGSNSTAPVHVYSNTGSYTITLIAYNNCGSDTAEQTINIVSTNNPPDAHNESVTITQPNSAVIDATGNDVELDGDSLCITSVTSLTSHSFFSLDSTNCHNILFNPDSSFYGRDTCMYVVCDNATAALCDTAYVLVVVNHCSPPNFSLTISCYDGFVGPGCWGLGYVIATGSNSDSLSWRITNLNNPTAYDSTIINDDSLLMGGWGSPELGGLYYGDWKVCATLSDFCGTRTVCDTISLWFEDIREVALSNIKIFPNPATTLLTIDMLQNTDEITKQFTGVEVSNALGEKTKTIPRDNQNRLVQLDVSDLPVGIFNAVIVGNKGERRALGRFTVQR